ncbi:MAG: A/G-specific adenine glycosylase [Betaproteobacteria bacterium]|nr:A/G-specific adenine glycosylase [Betaproteobacteria bacterium]
MPIPSRAFATRLITWHAAHGRHDLPWQNTRDPYPIWVSEIMLQQTQVGTVIPYYERFMARFANIRNLADADESDVLAHWAGLGYYARARNLHRAARRVRDLHGGVFPADRAAIEALPGIGRSTAAAIAAFAFGQRQAILDGNVKRVLARCFGIEGFPGERAVENELWALAEALLPDAKVVPVYIQAQMDLGATVCMRAKPRCAACPLADLCIARRENRVASLPTPRPAKPVPRRETAMLILMAGRDVLLERRPSSGIWGGLWSFPEIAAHDDAVAVANIRLGVRGSSGREMAPLEHGFTHFHLTIHPRLVEVRAKSRRAAEPGQLWMPIEDALDAAIPKPVKTLLQRLSETHA